MAKHINTGIEGEELATEWLINQGYTILHKNWRYKYFEIDIIATKGNFLHIIEVKCRNHSPTGRPEDSVTKKKFKHLQAAADEFLQQNPAYKWISYDIVSIILHKFKPPEIYLIEDVFL